MKEMIFAGFGGQSVLTAGLVTAYIAGAADLNPTWMPSYGPTMRGGKANCTVKFADEPGGLVTSPCMEEADVLVAMNRPSLDYLAFCKPGADVFVNSNAVSDYQYPEGLNIHELPVVEMALEVNNPRGAALIMTGAVLKTIGTFDEEFVVKHMRAMFDEKGKGSFNDANERALRLGFNTNLCTKK